MKVRALVFLSLLAMGCTTLRGRADDALAGGDYWRAIELYAEVLRRDPSDAEAKANLLRAEHGLLDSSLDRFEAHRRASRLSEALHAAFVALQAKDRVRPPAIDGPRREREQSLVAWTEDIAAKMVRHETSQGRALAARAWKASWAPLFARPELGSLQTSTDREIASAGARTCQRGTAVAGGQPFALELVAAYCGAVGAPAPEAPPRPLLVGGVVLRGTIAGTPRAEEAELRSAVGAGLERSVWFAREATARAAVDLEGSVSATFTSTPTELSRGWTEHIAYEATETYSDPVQVPYTDHESYTEQVPYTAYENGHPVTRYRQEMRTRPVTKYRTDYVERTRQVTRYRDEPRVFRWTATKHEGRYLASYRVTLLADGSGGPVTARGSSEDARSAYEHAAEFAPAGVHPEQGELPTALAWREGQRRVLARDLQRALDAAWLERFCSANASTLEDAARCAHARPRTAPTRVRERIAELLTDDVGRVLALPLPR